MSGPPDVAKLRAKGNVKGLIKALGYRQESTEGIDTMVRWRAANSLGDPANAQAVEPLVAALADQDHDVREAAAEALGKIGDARAVDPVLAVLGDHSQQAKVRMAAARALGAIGDTRAVEPLMVALDHDPDDNVRIVAAWALEPLGVPGMEVRAQSRRLLSELHAQE